MSCRPQLSRSNKPRLPVRLPVFRALDVEVSLHRRSSRTTFTLIGVSALTGRSAEGCFSRSHKYDGADKKGLNYNYIRSKSISRRRNCRLAGSSSDRRGLSKSKGFRLGADRIRSWLCLRALRCRLSLRHLVAASSNANVLEAWLPSLLQRRQLQGIDSPEYRNA